MIIDNSKIQARILYLVPDLFGPPSGIARYCRMVCRSLVASGHSLTTLSLLDDYEASREAQATFPTIRYASCAGQRAAFLRRSLGALKNRPSLILVGHPNFAPLGRMLGKVAGAKVINFIYGIDAWTPLSPSRQRALRQSDRIVSISRFTATRSAEVNGIAPDKVRILHNCLDPYFQEPPGEAQRVAEASPSILTVARINLSESYKGHDVIIRSLPALLKHFPHLVYDVVGDGDGRPVLEQLAREQGVAHAVKFHGAVSEAELIACYRKASVFVMPSRFEGFGFVFLEAMTYGKPVVCGNQDASIEVVADGETGFTVDPSSAQAVGDAVARLLGNSELCERMGRAGRVRVEEKFGFPHFNQQLQEIIADVMAA